MTQPAPDPQPAPPVPPVPQPPTPPSPPTDPPKPPDDPLGEGGKKALEAERKRANDAEKELAKYRKAEQDKLDADKSEAEKRAAAEERAAKAELAVARLEVAAEKGLTPAQARRLQGATREELAADADQILIDFPVTTATPAGPTAPKPDPSQGPKGTPPATRATSLGQAVNAALQKKA